MNAQVANLRILANAGSGKTYCLTARYLRLLALGVDPRRIIALTFTRKASGEFLDKILGRLVQAIPSPVSLAQLRQDLESPSLSQEDCIALLRRLVAALPRLSLGTLDSFFARMLHSFPFECGISGQIEVLQGNQQQEARKYVLQKTVEQMGATKQVFEDFLEVIRRASYGDSKIRVSDVLDGILKEFYEAFLQTPPHVNWGELPEQSVISQWKGNQESITRIIENLQSDALEGMPDFTNQQLKQQWSKFLEEMADWRPGKALPLFFERLVEGVLSTAPVDRTALTLNYNRKSYVFAGESGVLAVELVFRVAARVIESQSEVTKACYQLLEAYHANYQHFCRNEGMMSFLDITGLLAGSSGHAWRGAQTSFLQRQLMDYRLDESLDHWMLDEFQDTSRLQWAALENLIDEVVQDPEGRRSFFFVGDTKQAIYGWRGGDARLFEEIFDRYQQGGEGVLSDGAPLTKSYRCRRSIVEVVNSIFGNLGEVAPNMGFSSRAIHRWNQAWQPHETACADQPGYVRWEQFAKEEDSRYASLIGMLREVDPEHRGLDCAVLVRTNDKILEVSEALRAAGFSVSAEAKSYVCADNALGTTLLALLQFLRHPEDTLALEHIRMTPFAPLVEAEAFFSQSLKCFSAQGAAPLVRFWIQKVEPQLDEFSRQRLRDFLKACEAFDQESGSGLDALIRHLNGYEHREPESGSAIRVMTIHAAKGLTFDCVAMPVLERTSFTELKGRQQLYLSTSVDQTVTGALLLPAKAICALDPFLQKAREELVENATLENLCAFYVAMTRPRFALYLYSAAVKESSKAKDYAALLRNTLGDEATTFELGERTWYQRFPIQTKSEIELATTTVDLPHAVNNSPVTASGSGSPGARAGNSDALALGVKVHQWLAGQAWIEDPGLIPPADALPVPWLEPFLRSEAGRAVFSKPQQKCTLWREMPFDVWIDGQWTSGVFDRVVLLHNADGQLEEGRLYDFKSENCPAAELRKRYTAQLKLYRQALKKLTGLSDSQISLQLVALRGMQLIACD